MTNKNNDDDFDADFWLHVASDSLARYAESGGVLTISFTHGDLIVSVRGVTIGHEALHGRFVKMVKGAE